MIKIIAALLKKTYPSIDTESIMEIVMMTPNPQLATEKLCGIYEAPSVPMSPGKYWVNRYSNRMEMALNSYDEWHDTVSYSYTAYKQEYIYYPKSVNGIINNSNYKEHAVDRNHGLAELDSKWFTSETETEIKRDSCTFEEWTRD